MGILVIVHAMLCGFCQATAFYPVQPIISDTDITHGGESSSGIRDSALIPAVQVQITACTLFSSNKKWNEMFNEMKYELGLNVE